MKESVTTLVPSAKADSACFISVFPALRCRAFTSRRNAGGTRRPPRPFGPERRNRLVKAAVYVLAVILLPGAAMGVEHPGVVPKDAECTSCHAAKMRGRSVHSVMAASCDVCHVTQTQGDMTLVSLSMPKQKICFACHQESSALREHVPAVKGQCMECHDAHSSDQKMLLRVAALSSRSK